MKECRGKAIIWEKSVPGKETGSATGTAYLRNSGESSKDGATQ